MKIQHYLIALLFVAVSFQEARADDLKRILVLPFDIHSQEDLSFLRNGIQDMLTSRLTHEGRAVLGKDEASQALAGIPEVNLEAAKLAGKRARADFVVFGAVTVFGTSISTDATVVDVSSGQKALSFSDIGKEDGDVIAHVNRFASEVNENVFGQKAAAPPSPSSKQSTPVDESRRNPESLWTGKIEAETGHTTEAGSGGSLWRSRNFDMEIRSISLGDVDGDGSMEAAFISEKTLMVYRYVNERFVKIAEETGNPNDEFLSVDAADINGNGKVEIFVTAINPDINNLRSFVLEWEGRQFQKVIENENMFFRVIDAPGRGRILAGQKKGGNSVFVTGIDELKWNGTTYTPENRLAQPLWINVFGFNYGDLAQNGAEMTVAFTEKDYLRILDPDGKVEWESPEEFMGGSVYVKFPMEASASIGGHTEMDHKYLPQRILVADVDKDGKLEVIVGKKKDMIKGLFGRLRLFKAGHIECLGWDNLGLYSEWKTREISGNLSDYTLGDIDNDGVDELVFCVIQQTSSVISKPKSYIAVQDIIIVPPKQ